MAQQHGAVFTHAAVSSRVRAAPTYALNATTRYRRVSLTACSPNSRHAGHRDSYAGNPAPSPDVARMVVARAKRGQLRYAEANASIQQKPGALPHKGKRDEKRIEKATAQACGQPAPSPAAVERRLSSSTRVAAWRSAARGATAAAIAQTPAAPAAAPARQRRQHQQLKARRPNAASRMLESPAATPRAIRLSPPVCPAQ